MSRHDYVLMGTGLYPDDGFSPLFVFVLEEAANAMCTLCQEYELTRPPTAYDSDKEFERQMRRIRKWHKAHPGGEDAGMYCSFSVYKVRRI